MIGSISDPLLPSNIYFGPKKYSKDVSKPIEQFVFKKEIGTALNQTALTETHKSDSFFYNLSRNYDGKIDFSSSLRMFGYEHNNFSTLQQNGNFFIHLIWFICQFQFLRS